MATSQTISAGLGASSATAGYRLDVLAHRRANAYLLSQSAPGIAKPGVIGAVSPVAGIAGQMKYTISAFGAVLTRTPDVGAVVIASPATITLDTGAAPSTNPRIDAIYVYQPLEDQGDTAGLPVVAVAQGTAAASPVAPTVPNGALILALHRVAPGDSGTATANGFTSVAADVSIPSVVAALADRIAVLESRPRLYSTPADPAASGSVPDGSVWVQPGS